MKPGALSSAPPHRCRSIPREACRRKLGPRNRGSDWSTRVNHNTIVYRYRSCTQCHLVVPAHYTHSIIQCRPIRAGTHIQSYSVDQSETPVAGPCRMPPPRRARRRSARRRSRHPPPPRRSGARAKESKTNRVQGESNVCTLRLQGLKAGRFQGLG